MEDFRFSDRLEMSLGELIYDLMSEFDFQIGITGKQPVKSGTIE